TTPTPSGAPSALPLVHYHRWRILTTLGLGTDAQAALTAARECDDRWCFPVRLDDVAVLEAVLCEHADPRAAALLGHWMYHHGRSRDAIAHWESAVDDDPGNAVAWRNLGLARHRTGGPTDAVTTAYDRAVMADPGQPRLWFERDQLAERTGTPLSVRIRDLEARPTLVRSRDDSTTALANLYLSVGRTDEAIALLDSHDFQPWEGGEGPVLRVWERAQLARSRALTSADPGAALLAVESAIDPPPRLGEQRHPLASAALLHLVQGDLLDRLHRPHEARLAWQRATARLADFVDMQVQPISAVSFACVLAHHRLGDGAAADELINRIEQHCSDLEADSGAADFFATSRPVTMVFPPDPVVESHRLAALVRAQLDACRGDRARAVGHVTALLRDDPGHSGAHDLHQWLQHPGFFPVPTASAGLPKKGTRA
ncbi:MAG TPA: tetratricopeptide repeat protein, partial [Bacillota bacterium]|nr:tetratricopeptide repeat protein [Bacillota bacterium]